jgi:hypothetical protein
LSKLQIAPGKKGRRKAGPLVLLLVILAIVGAVVAVYAFTMKDERGFFPAKNAASAKAAPAAPPKPAGPAKPGDIVLTVSGYVIPRERIELSPRFPKRRHRQERGHACPT